MAFGGHWAEFPAGNGDDAIGVFPASRREALYTEEEIRDRSLAGVSLCKGEEVRTCERSHPLATVLEVDASKYVAAVVVCYPVLLPSFLQWLRSRAGTQVSGKLSIMNQDALGRDTPGSVRIGRRGRVRRLPAI